MKTIYVIVGLIAFGLAAVGAFVPILPTVPFLLVSAFCFARGSERLNSWFKGTKLYKNNLDSFVKGKGMTVKTKIRIIATVTILMGTGFVMMKNTPIGRICISIVWVAHVIAFVFFIKTTKENGEEEAKELDK